MSGPWPRTAHRRTSILPRDPDFAREAGRILDLYARCWEGDPLTIDDFVFSADEKTSIQARLRKHPSTPPRAGQPMRAEHEYARGGAWTYLPALDVHRGKLFGRCDVTAGIAPFDRLVTQVMTLSPYREARGVFWILDNGDDRKPGLTAELTERRLSDGRGPEAPSTGRPTHRRRAEATEFLEVIPVTGR